MSSCCASKQQTGFQFDPIYHGSVIAILLISSLALIPLPIPFVQDMAHGVWDLLSIMWWGIAIGLVVVGIMTKIPREYFNAMLGRGDTFGGLIRATAAGLLLDLCSHGIVMVGAKLYERGASLGQTMAFLIASPWNSISLTLILVTLVGLEWTLVFIAASAVIAIISGVIFQQLVKRGVLPDNPNTLPDPEPFDIMANTKRDIKKVKLNGQFLYDITLGSWREARIIVKWLLFGTLLAAAARTFIPADSFADWFGPTMLGLGATLLATTLIEVCSEGSTPLASDLMHRAGAPGNGFTFLMAGVATDYTEIMIIKEFTGRWVIALALPLVTVPQVVLLGWIMNQWSLAVP